MMQGKRGTGTAPMLPPEAGRRYALAATLRRRRSEVGETLTRQLDSYWPTMEANPDTVSGIMAHACYDLPATLAFALELDDPTLPADQVRWMADVLRVRGYDAGIILSVVLDSLEQTCRTLLDGAASAADITLILGVGRRAISAAVADGTAE